MWSVNRDSSPIFQPNGPPSFPKLTKILNKVLGNGLHCSVPAGRSIVQFLQEEVPVGILLAKVIIIINFNQVEKFPFCSGFS